MANQTQSTDVSVIESCRVAPPDDSLLETSLRLTFFDVMWLGYQPVQRLFFFRLPPPYDTTTSSFHNSIIPRLKLSLSQTLLFFYPLAGNIVLSDFDSTHHEIRYKPGDSVSLIVAECRSGCYHRLSGNNIRNAVDLHPLSPRLPPVHPIGGVHQPGTAVLALQVTHFPNEGICIGMSVNHTSADGWSSTHFMKCWASIFRTGGSPPPCKLPIYDRTGTAKLDWITRKHFSEMEKVKMESTEKPQVREQLLRATVLLRQGHIEGLRRKVLANNTTGARSASSFVLTCAYLWATLVRARRAAYGSGCDDQMAHFVFAVDCRRRLEPPLPEAYFGNCIGGAFVEARFGDLVREGGVEKAAAAIRRTIDGLAGEEVMKGAERWMARALEIVRSGSSLLSIAGSPRLRVYETDFGWGGKVEKVEMVSIEDTGAISLAESREEAGGMEIGVALSNSHMEAFMEHYQQGLKCL